MISVNSSLTYRVEFQGEIGLDRGGLAKEMFTIAIRDLITCTNVFSPCSNGHVYWFTRCSAYSFEPIFKHRGTETINNDMFDNIQPEFLLGLLASLAVYNGIFVDVPLPSSIYKVLLGNPVSQISSPLYPGPYVVNSLVTVIRSLVY